MSELGLQLSLMALEAVLAASVLLLLFRVRSIFGLAPIYTTVGVFYYLATLLAGTTYVKVAPGLLMSPGSVALFPASLFSVLFVYIREDAKEARNMIYALLAANIVASVLGVIVSQHLLSPLAFNPLALSPEVFEQQPRLFVVGTLALFADTVLIILAYETVSRRVASLFLRIYASLALVLIFDTLLFVTGGFVEHPAYREILLSGVLGKVTAALVYSAVLTVYLARFDTAAPLPAGARHDLGDLFQVLTYRQKYEALRAQAMRDSVTGVYNRGFFDDVLKTQLATSKRSGTPVAVMMIDVDHFKRINDRYGHTEGDRVLRTVAQALVSAVRASDIVSRYGGEEFCIIMPNTQRASAALLAARVLAEVPQACADAGMIDASDRVTVTIGVAACPEDTEDLDELMRYADQRLYRGKDTGRDRVVST
ncbi:MAG TPA: diguanylate cyclase [Burkholderiales bacterium]|nr:diguanylate cyclase [Burkholderiales bacterium]